MEYQGLCQPYSSASIAADAKDRAECPEGKERNLFPSGLRLPMHHFPVLEMIAVIAAEVPTPVMSLPHSERDSMPAHIGYNPHRAR